MALLTNVQHALKDWLTFSYKKLFIGIWVLVVASFYYYIFTGKTHFDISTYIMMTDGMGHIRKQVVAFILSLYVIHPVFLFPASFITPIVGTLFGPGTGSLIAYIGALLSASASFFFARYFRNAYFSTKEIPLIGKINHASRSTFLVVLMLHLGPVFPFDLINYAAGISKINYRTYILATALGIIPGVLISVFLGSSFFEPRFFFIAIALTIILYCVFRKKEALINKDE